jgi:hypothetical protein
MVVCCWQVSSPVGRRHVEPAGRQDQLLEAFKIVLRALIDTHSQSKQYKAWPTNCSEKSEQHALAMHKKQEMMLLQLINTGAAQAMAETLALCQCDARGTYLNIK